jgi:protein gp37
MIDRVLAAAILCPQHMFQLLTKRPQRACAYLEDGPAREIAVIDAMAKFVGKGAPFAGNGRTAHLADRDSLLMPPNVWLGVTAENQDTFDERTAWLEKAPAAVRFVSLEPICGPIEMGERIKSIEWVIAGGESGPKAAPSHPDWFRSIRDQCQAAGVAFHHKQNGEFLKRREFTSHVQWVNKASTWLSRGDVCMDAAGRICRIGKDFAEAVYPIGIYERVGKKASGRLLDGRTWDEFPVVKV